MAAIKYSFEDIEAIAKHLKSTVDINPKIGIICGTGLGGLADTLSDRVTISYNDIPNFPVSTVEGHEGKLIFGTIDNRSVVCMKGRFHLYEGYQPSQVTLPVRVMKLLGVEVLFVTNASGGLNKSYKVGDLMVMKDHIFFPGIGGMNPLVGQNDERFGPRFPALSNVYDRELRNLAQQASEELGLDKYVRYGVYGMNVGPAFETIAECRMFQILGADVVGMSTCPEAVVAVHCGMKVFGMSLVTNECVTDYDDDRAPNHAEVLEAADMRAKNIQDLVRRLVTLIPDAMLA